MQSFLDAKNLLGLKHGQDESKTKPYVWPSSSKNTKLESETAPYFWPGSSAMKNSTSRGLARENLSDCSNSKMLSVIQEEPQYDDRLKTNNIIKEFIFDQNGSEVLNFDSDV